MDAHTDTSMLLQGSINRFSLVGVLQFLAQNSARGVLEVRDCEEYGFVYLVDGRVEGISMPISDARLGTRLLSAGCLSRQQLAEALREDSALSYEQRRLKPLGQRLVEKGFTSEVDLRQVLRRQTLDQVFELAHWRDGVFVYDETKAMPQFQIMIQGDVQQLLYAAHRRIDEGERARKTRWVVADNAECVGCSLTARCTPEIKAKYLKEDICLWREMSAVVVDRYNRFTYAGDDPKGEDSSETSFYDDERYGPGKSDRDGAFSGAGRDGSGVARLRYRHTPEWGAAVLRASLDWG